MKYIFLSIFLSTCVFLNAQVGIGTDSPNATLHVDAKEPNGTSTNLDGILIPRIDRERAQLMANVLESTLVYIDDFTKGDQDAQAINIDSNGFYYFLNGEWVKLSQRPNTQDFFYMPSVSLPTLKTDSRVADVNNLSFTYDAANDEFSVDLYNIFKNQFNNPLAKSSTANEVALQYNGALPTNTNSGLTEFVLSSFNYQYFVTFADLNLFTKIAVSDDGVLTYKVDASTIIRNGSFMNIVLKVKN